MGEVEAVEILKGQGMSQEEAEDFIAGMKRGITSMHKGDRIPWSELKKELGLTEEGGENNGN